MSSSANLNCTQWLQLSASKIAYIRTVLHETYHHLVSQGVADSVATSSTLVGPAAAVGGLCSHSIHSCYVAESGSYAGNTSTSCMGGTMSIFVQNSACHLALLPTSSMLQTLLP